MTIPFPIPSKVRTALERVLSYAIPDEANDYDSTPPEDRDGRIYEALVTVRTWLHTGLTPNSTGKLIEHAPLDTLAIRGHA